MEQELHCPICCVPFSCLKIAPQLHVDHCDIGKELLDCPDGERCCSSCIFHYRDFSHQKLSFALARRGNDYSAQDFEHIRSDVKNNKNTYPALILDRFQTYSHTHTHTTEIDNGLNLHEDNDLSNRRSVSVEHFKNKRVKVSNEQTLVPVETNDSLKHDFRLTSSSDNPSVCCIGETSAATHTTQSACKEKWASVFLKTLKVNEDDKSPTSKKNKSFSSSNKVIKRCPNYKKIPGTSFAVDAFQYGNLYGISYYFLTHFHADHYMGLKKSFSNHIYCSLITANLVKKKLRVRQELIHVLPLNESVVINNVEVTFFDANHCPGAVIILFRLLNGQQILHVGDFRACQEMKAILEKHGSHIDSLYLDTTYFSPDYDFPTQKEVIDRVKEMVNKLSQKHKNALFVCGTYSIGMLEVLNCKMWAQPSKVDIFRCLNNDIILSALTTNPSDAQLHVLPMCYLQFNKLNDYVSKMQNAHFSHIFAFRPSGWEISKRKGDDWVNISVRNNTFIFGIPYSEHSNYEELCRFVKFVKPSRVIATVPMKNREMYKILQYMVDSSKNSQSKQMTLEDYVLGRG